MADLVLGLAQSTVEGMLTAAKSAIEEEEKLKKSMKRDLLLISDEFEMMQSFLNVAKDHASDEMVRTLVRQVRNMALDVEDCIESVVLTDIKPHWWRFMLPFCIAAVPADPLGDAATSIGLLKSRVEAMGQRNERYRHIGGSSSKSTADKMHQQAVADATAVGILIEAREARKKHRSPKDLIELVNKIDSALPLQVISLWGAVGDLGVASIIKKTCDDPNTCESFKFRAWVKLMQPFRPHEFIRSLLAQFYTIYCPKQGSPANFNKFKDMMKATEDVVMEEFMKQVSDQRYLIFLEDVSSTVDWETVRVYLPDQKNGSCIVVHTQQLEVASLCVGQSHRVFELEQFSAEHSVCVFFNEDKRGSPRDLVDLIKKTLHAHPLQVISVFGAVDDLGMASIMKMTCDDDPEICSNFRYRAWVKLMHPFDPYEFSQSMLLQFRTNYCPRHGSALDFLKLNCMMKDMEVTLIEFVKNVMTDQRYLVFLEDLSSTGDWEAVREYLPDKNNGSFIIVHAQQLNDARSFVGESHREMEQFTANHSVHVFCNKNMDEDEDRATKMKVAKEWLEKYQRVGRQADYDFLYDNIAAVYSVCGIAGVGKSYIVKYVYNKQVMDQHFQKFGWVDVSYPFNIRDFSRSLLLDLHSGSLHHGSMLRIKDPIQDCRELLRQHKCLIVIDGIQSTEEWDLIKTELSFEQDRHRIIVITHKESVADYCSRKGGGWTWTVEGLEIDDAFVLLKKMASTKWPEDPTPADIEEIKIILHKCGGLPQVIAALGEFMAEGQRINGDFTFMWMLENDPTLSSRLKGMFDWVDSYFQSCDDKLKPCIFYLSIFPVNHKIRRRRLVRRWIAEGYARDTKKCTAEENAVDAIVDLRNQNLIQVPGSTCVTYLMLMSSCQVNGFFREYIISRSMEENLVFQLEGYCSVNSKKNSGRHLTIGSTWDRDKSVYESIDFSQLRSLTVFGKWETFLISDKMNILRVLDLEDASSVTDGDLEQMVKLLPRLKFLSLRGCKDITRLPDSIGGLRQLQTLDIRHTSIVVLPLSITKLKKLQDIRAGTRIQQLDDQARIVESLRPPEEVASASAFPSLTTQSISMPRTSTHVSRIRMPQFWTRRRQMIALPDNGGVEVPRGIGKMKALYNISVIDANVASGPSILEELKNLKQLRKLGVSGVKLKNCKELCSAISGHPRLESLSLWVNKNQAGCLDAISPPPEQLHSLKLYGHIDKLPAWVKLLNTLTKLKLQLTRITQDDVDLIIDLPRLDTLCLCFKEYQYGHLRFRRGFSFCQLSVLEIVCNSRLQSVTFEPEVMNVLELLKIRCCESSPLLFSGLDKLQYLKEVLLSGSYDEKLKQHLQSQLEKHPREGKPVLKLKVE